jgi:hypothetical protein
MATDADDWWNNLYDDEDTEPAEPVDEETPAETEDDEQAGPGWWAPQPGYWPRPHIPAALTHAPEKIAISPRTRAFLYNASAAGAGWGLGLYHQFAAAVADCGQQYSISGALVLGVGGCLVIAHVWDRRTRHWWPGIAWAARIPLATAIVALAFWTPASV